MSKKNLISRLLGLEEWPKNFDDNDLVLKICQHYKIHLYIFFIGVGPIPGTSIFRTTRNIGGPDDTTIPIALLYKNDQTRHHYAWMVPSLSKPTGKHFPLLDFIQCHICQRWKKFKRTDIKLSVRDHVKACRICNVCGQAWQLGDAHEETCNKPYRYVPPNSNRFVEKKPIEQCRLFTKAQSKKMTMKTCWFADFETLSEVTVNKGSYQTYCAVLMPPTGKTAEDVLVFYGKNTMKEFVDYLIKNVRGIVWWFNGSRFDMLLLEAYFIANNIRIIRNTMSRSSMISMVIHGNRGEITFKDMARFTFGTLAQNCKSFGLPVDESKTDFDHNKMKSWDDVELYKDEVIEYARMDAVSLAGVTRRYAETVFSTFKVQMTKFDTLAAMSYAIFTTSIKNESLLIKTPIEYENTFREAYRGGRLVVTTKLWRSSCFEDMIKGHAMAGNAFEPEMVEKVKDYLVYIDVNSLYPTAMAGRQYPCGTFEHVKKINEKEERAIRRQFHSIYHCYAYAEGDYIFPRKNDKDIEPSDIIVDRMTKGQRRKDLKNRLRLMMFKVDYVCDKTVLIPFLMSRDPKGKKDNGRDTLKDAGKARQTLHDGFEAWYTGVELLEFVKQRGIVTKIHEMIIFNEQAELFTEFIKTNYEAKKKAAPNEKTKDPGDPVLYMVAKIIMNALSGKFGQLNHPITLIHIPNEDYSEQEQRYKALEQEIESIFAAIDESGSVSGFFIRVKKIISLSQFPIQLSVFILAFSKLIMSKLLDALGGYRNPRLCPLYGDTDSLIVVKEAYDNLPEKWKGKELGQVKNEEAGNPIVCLIVLAPKTYMYLYIDKKTRKLLCKMKCKGIPHYKEPYDPFERTIFTETEKELFKKDLVNLWLRRDNVPCPNVVFKTQRFIVMKISRVTKRNRILEELEKDRMRIKKQLRNNEIERAEARESLRNIEGLRIEACEHLIDKSYFLEKLTYDALISLHCRTHVIECVFPQMKRCAFSTGWSNEVGVTPDYGTRNVVSNYWWDAGHRIYKDEQNDIRESKIAYPPGHECLKEEEEK